MPARPSSIVVVVALIAQLLMPIGVAGAGERTARRELLGAKVARVDKPQRSAKAASRQRRQLAPAAGAKIPTADGLLEVGKTFKAEPETAAEAQPDASPAISHGKFWRKPLHGQLRQAQTSAGNTVITEERPFFEFGGFAFGLEYGLTLSEFRMVRDPEKKGVEWIHVVNLDGRSNFETVLARWPLKKGKSRRIELQGPALNSDVSSPVPLGLRLFGVGLTDDFVDREAHEAVSYTAEVKASERTLAELAMLGVPLVAKLLPNAGAIATRIAETMLAAVPVVNVLFAANTLWRVRKVFANPASTTGQKLMATAHLAADVLRVFAPVVGTVVSVSLVAFFGLRSYFKLRALKTRS